MPLTVSTTPDAKTHRLEANQPAPTSTSTQTHKFPRSFSAIVAVLFLAFAKPLYDLVRYSLSTDLYSHVLLIPFISAYFFWQLKSSLPSVERSFRSRVAYTLIAAGVLVLVTFALRAGSGKPLPENDYLAFTIFPFVCFLIAVCILFLGTAFAKAAAFPLGFLIFLVPFPTVVETALEMASVHASAQVYSWMMSLSNATYYRDGLVFVLPNLPIRVAQECSGIRSSFVLFLTSLIAGQMFLKSSRYRFYLAAAVFPLGILRNAFRIFVLSMASVYWNPNVIHSPLHHKGGPIFFVLSLVPFFLFLIWLRKAELKKASASQSRS